MEATATGPRVLLGEFSVVLAVRAGEATEDEGADQTFVDVVTINDLAADDATSAGEETGADGLADGAGVRLRGFNGVDLTRDGAGAADDVVNALRNVDGASAEASVPRHDFILVFGFLLLNYFS